MALDAHLAAEALVNRVTGAGRARLGRPAITVVVDADTVARGPHAGGVCETESGAPIPHEAMNRCACDAVVRTVTVDSRGVATDVGRAQRTATAAQWAALTAMYSRCAWYGCDRPIGWCQAHHVVYWDHFGPTDLANLVPLCSRHHHLVHDGGWRLVLTPDRALEHYQPDGTPWRTTHPDSFQACRPADPDTSPGAESAVRGGSSPADSAPGAESAARGRGRSSPTDPAPGAESAAPGRLACPAHADTAPRAGSAGPGRPAPSERSPEGEEPRADRSGSHGHPRQRAGEAGELSGY